MVKDNLNILSSFMCDYLLAITFCFIGSLIREYYRAAKKKAKIKIGRALINAIAMGLISTAIYKIIYNEENYSISVFVLITVAVGFWSTYILDALSNKKIVIPFLQKFLATLFPKIGKSFAEAWKECTDAEAAKEKEKEEKSKKEDAEKS